MDQKHPKINRNNQERFDLNLMENHLILEIINMNLGKNNMNQFQIHMNEKPVDMNLGINYMNPEQTGIYPVLIAII